MNETPTPVIENVNHKNTKEKKEKKPATVNVGTFKFGPSGPKEGESRKAWRSRVRLEKKMFKIRMKKGISHWPISAGTYTNPTKRQAKNQRKANALRK